MDWSPEAVKIYDKHGGLPKSQYRGRVGITWTLVGNVSGSFRLMDRNELYSSGSPTIFTDDQEVTHAYLAALNSGVVGYLLDAINPTMNTGVGNVLSLPQVDNSNIPRLAVLAKDAWSIRATSHEEQETSPRFKTLLELMHVDKGSLQAALENARASRSTSRDQYKSVISEIESIVRRDFRFTRDQGDTPLRLSEDPPQSEIIRRLISYAVGCMFGRYSLDKPGLILAEQGASLDGFLSQLPNPRFRPDIQNAIPIVDGVWFEDDIVSRFRQFLRVAFGDKSLEANLTFIEQVLGKTIRKYFMSDFYKDHVRRYKKCPIYWMFSSPKGSFGALIYVHRYTPSTVSTVLNDYLREFQTKLNAELQNLERSSVAVDSSSRDIARALKDISRYRKILVELEQYERDVLYPLATQQLSIDLDDGVRVNYGKLGAALKKIQGLEAARE